MKALWFCFLLQTVYAQVGFGRSYLRNSRLCHQWNCLNTKLGLPDELPPKEQMAGVLNSLLVGQWRDRVPSALNVCYGARPRKYANTCPGQAIMHCVLDQLIDNCPQEHLEKDAACTPIYSYAGYNYLFSQSRYKNLNESLPNETRPPWFMQNYFNAKCCALPTLFNASVMSECGVSTMVHYHEHQPLKKTGFALSFKKVFSPISAGGKHHTSFIHHNGNVNQAATPATNGDVLKIVDLNSILPVSENVDPLECCDMSEFVQPQWRTECGFQTMWGGPARLVITEPPLTTTAAPTTTTARTDLNKDVKIVPVTCNKENCVFRKLNIVSASGAVDKDAFSKLLDNMTSIHPEWTKAKARVVTKCLSKPIVQYDHECEINKVLACTFDVLSENCPHAKKSDPCKHTSVLKNDISCQISSSKYRPKNRRQFCGVPSLVPSDVLSQCDTISLTHMEFVPNSPAMPRMINSWTTNKSCACKGSTDATKCLMTKMDVFNKYGFLDYFKMKDRIRNFADSNEEWKPYKDNYLNVFMGTPILYREHCNSPKKLLNVIDAMLTTCPMSRKKQTPQCNKIFNELSFRNNETKNITKEKMEKLLSYFKNVFISKQQPHFKPYKYFQNKIRGSAKKSDYGFGIMNSNDAPHVKVMEIKPSVMYKRPSSRIPPGINEKPRVILPVYLRPRNDTALRSF